MPKQARDALNAKGKTDVWYFDPNDVVLVEDEQSPVYDERVHNTFDEALVVSMLYAPDGKTPQGVLKILVGSRNPETGKVEITDGRQRTLACREACRRLKKQGLPPVRLPVHLRRLNSSQLMATMITANEHHRVDTPTQRALKAQRYVNLGHDEREVGEMLGVQSGTVKAWLRLLDAPAVVRNAVDSGKVTARDGDKLSRLAPEEARAKLAELLEKAPRVPGKKRSPNAQRAREVMGGGAGKPAPTSGHAPRGDDAVAEAIAAWVERTWNGDENWDGSPKDIPQRIRAGEWRSA